MSLGLGVAEGVFYSHQPLAGRWGGEQVAVAIVHLSLLLPKVAEIYFGPFERFFYVGSQAPRPPVVGGVNLGGDPHAHPSLAREGEPEITAAEDRTVFGHQKVAVQHALAVLNPGHPKGGLDALGVNPGKNAWEEPPMEKLLLYSERCEVSLARSEGPNFPPVSPVGGEPEPQLPNISVGLAMAFRMTWDMGRQPRLKIPLPPRRLGAQRGHRQP